MQKLLSIQHYSIFSKSETNMSHDYSLRRLVSKQMTVNCA